MQDEKLIERIKNRDESAIAELMDKYDKLLWSVVAAVLEKNASVQDMEECVADVYIYLWHNSDIFDPSRGSLRSWLCMLARSRAIDRLRSLRINDSLPIEILENAESPGPEVVLLRGEDRKDLENAISMLEGSELEVFQRRHVLGQKPAEIALATGLSVKQVKNSLYRSKLRIRKELEGQKKD